MPETLIAAPTSLLAIGAHLGEILEPDDEIEVVILDVQPLTWRADTLYVYPVAESLVPIETGPPSRQDFAFVCVLVVDNEGEEAMSTRDQELAIWLSNRAARYRDTLREMFVSEPFWATIRVAMEISPRTLQNRGLAMRVTGYRLLS